jgi:hypothetical protein
MKFNKKTLNMGLVAVVVAVVFVALYYIWRKPAPPCASSPCPPPTPLYKYYGGKLLPGYDIEYLPNLKGNVPALQEACNNNLNCLSFSTDGHLKSNSDPALLVPCGDMYFKVVGPPVPITVPIPPAWATNKNSLDSVKNDILVGNNYIASPVGQSDNTTLLMNPTGDLELYNGSSLLESTNTGNANFAGASVLLRDDGSLYLIANTSSGLNTFQASPSFGFDKYVLWVENSQINLMDSHGNVRNIKLNAHS